ncbi:hypothetical protein QIS74_04199 [Colletotrichum tabaci]|uniref:FAD-binding PCMH-type domain-containing protein n=1 Tax=Colletotrichum tabaci TaxID=1209068 RepID=A0AAV9TLF1_9PEZI
MSSLYHQTRPEISITKGSRRNSWSAAAATVLAGLAAQYFLVPGSGIRTAGTPSAIERCLDDVCAGASDCVQFPSKQDGAVDSGSWMRPFNLGLSSVPTAIVRPRNAGEVAGAVKCALKHNFKVQAKAGGHSYANHGLGGQNGAISVDMEYFRYAHVESAGPSYNVRVGGGTRLGQIDESLQAHQRAVPHGMCIGIGIGGHATVGGIGPASRLWGTTLDNVEEMEVVTANGTIVRASTKENPDLFFAMRGAGSGFGIVTEFVMRTHPAPPAVLHFTQDFAYGNLKEMVDVFDDWQTVVADPALDHRLGTEIVLTPQGAHIMSTWYGDEADLRQTGILDRLPAGGYLNFRQESWGGSLALLAAEESMHRPEKPGRLHSRSRGLSRGDLLSREHISAAFDKLERGRDATGPWAIKFQAVGGAVSEVPAAGTAYAHRDDVVLYHSFAADASKDVRDLLDEFHRALLNMAPGASGTYPGFADPELRDPQLSYWGSNLAALEEIKGRWDPENVFHNPQSVVPRA